MTTFSFGERSAVAFLGTKDPLSNPDEMSLVDSLQFQVDCIQGCIVGVKKDKATLLWKWAKEMMESLIRMGCIDDDQHILLMIYKKYYGYCHINICGWFKGIEITSGRAFRTGKSLEKEKTQNSEQFLSWEKNNLLRVERYYRVKEENNKWGC